MASTDLAERLAVVQRTGAMLSIDDAMLTTGDDLTHQIEVRKKIYGDLVGAVYPAVVWGEVEMLTERQAKTRRWAALYRE